MHHFARLQTLKKTPMEINGAMGSLKDSLKGRNGGLNGYSPED